MRLRTTVILGLLVFAATCGNSFAQTQNNRTARETFRAFMDAVLRGNSADAADLAKAGKDPNFQKQLTQIKQAIGRDRLAIEAVYMSEVGRTEPGSGGEAIALFEPISVKFPGQDKPQQGQLLLHASRLKGTWLIKSINFFPGDAAKDKVAEFLKTNPDAKPAPGIDK